MLPPTSAYNQRPKAPSTHRKTGTLSLALDGARRLAGVQSKRVSSTGTKRKPSARELMCNELPSVFCPKGYPRPLAVGIHAAVMKRTGWPLKEVRKILGKHCCSFAYLKAVAWKHSERHDLDGYPVGPVSDEDRLYAADLLVKVVNPAKHVKQRRMAHTPQ